MTYLAYANQVVSEFQSKTASAKSIYQSLDMANGYINATDAELYLSKIKECHAIANLAEHLFKAMLNGELLPNEPID